MATLAYSVVSLPALPEDTSPADVPVDPWQMPLTHHLMPTWHCLSTHSTECASGTRRG